MKLYSCKVRLSGSLYNEVPKSDVTAPEIQILRVLHGDDAVAEIRETGRNKVGQAEERARLIEAYGGGLVAQQLGKLPDQAFNSVFGIAGRLPDDVPGALKGPKPVAPPEPEPEGDEPDENPEE